MTGQAISEVLSGKPLATGGILGAPLGTALPTDATTAPAAAFKAFGYIGEDGVTQTIDRSTDKIKAWGGKVVKIVQSEFSVTYSFTFLQAYNEEVLKAVHGEDNVVVTAADATTGKATAVKINSAQLAHSAYIFEIKDGADRVRVAVPDGQITEVGDVTFNDEGVISYEVTVEAFEDAAGNNAYIYHSDGKPSV